MAELAVLSRARPVDDEAKAQKAPRSAEARALNGVPRKCRAPQESRGSGCTPNNKIKYAGVAELADALDLGSSVTHVQVQVLSPAPNKRALHKKCFFVFISLQ